MLGKEGKEQVATSLRASKLGDESTNIERRERNSGDSILNFFCAMTF